MGLANRPHQDSLTVCQALKKVIEILFAVSHISLTHLSHFFLQFKLSCVGNYLSTLFTQPLSLSLWLMFILYIFSSIPGLWIWCWFFHNELKYPFKDGKILSFKALLHCLHVALISAQSYTSKWGLILAMQQRVQKLTETVQNITKKVDKSCFWK